MSERHRPPWPRVEWRPSPELYWRLRDEAKRLRISLSAMTRLAATWGLNSMAAEAAFREQTRNADGTLTCPVCGDHVPPDLLVSCARCGQLACPACRSTDSGQTLCQACRDFLHDHPDAS